MSPFRSPPLRIAISIGLWWGGLTLVSLLSLYLSGATVVSLHTGWGLLGAIGSRVWLVFPFVTFAGGLAAAQYHMGAVQVNLRALLLITVCLGTAAYSIGTMIAPIAEVEADRSAGFDAQARYPAGPQTPLGIVRRRAALLESPPPSYSFSVDRPLEHPPNWLTYLLHQPMAWMVFSILNALLGLQVARGTANLRAPRRRHVRWSIGLVTGMSFFAAAVIGGNWVRMSPDNSGLLGAWIPILLPSVELLLAYGLLRLQRRDLHIERTSSV